MKLILALIMLILFNLCIFEVFRYYGYVDNAEFLAWYYTWSFASGFAIALIDWK